MPSLFRMTDSAEAAIKEITGFYRVYHSERYVGGHLVFRLNVAPEERTLKDLSAEFADVLDGPIEAVDASQAEKRDNDVPDLPRIGHERPDGVDADRYQLLPGVLQLHATGLLRPAPSSRPNRAYRARAAWRRAVRARRRRSQTR